MFRRYYSAVTPVPIMSITTKLRIENDRLALTPTLRRLDGVDMRVISHGNTAPGVDAFPYLIEHDDQAELEAALTDDTTVASYDIVDCSEGTGIYYISHTPETELISPAVMAVNGYLIDTETNDSGWIVRLLLPDREALDSVWTYANEHEMDVDIIEIYGSDASSEQTYGLTDAQLAALRVAYDRGYFNEPRDASLTEIADELGLSSTATSGRLRRGMRNLLSATLSESSES